MLVAHLPSGYLLGTIIERFRRARDRSVLAAAIIGGVAPDVDMFYFYPVDGRQTHHHEYFTHWPLFWLAITIGLAVLVTSTKRDGLPLVLAFGSAAMLHMVLDTVAAPILWLMPFSPQVFELVTVPATHQNWILSFTLHWTFVLEIMIWITSIAVFVKRRRIEG